MLGERAAFACGTALAAAPDAVAATAAAAAVETAQNAQDADFRTVVGSLRPPPPAPLPCPARDAGDGDRAAEGRALEERGCVKRVGEFQFEVESIASAAAAAAGSGREQRPRTYSVILVGGEDGYADCDCPDHRLRCTPHCKHVHAALAMVKREEDEAKRADEDEAKRADDFAASSLIDSMKSAAEAAHRGCNGGCGGARCTEAAVAATMAAASTRQSKAARRKRCEEIERLAAHTAAVAALWYDSSGGGLYDLADVPPQPQPQPPPARPGGGAAAAAAGGIAVRAVRVGSECHECHGTHIVKNGWRPNKNYRNQRYRCRDCGKSFSANLGFEGRKYDPAVVTRALNMRFSGTSLRAVCLNLSQDGIFVRPRTVLNWVEGCVFLAEPYVETLRPAVSRVWRIDEMVVGVEEKGHVEYVVSMLDTRTRYHLALQEAALKGTSDVAPVFERAAALAGFVPTVLVSDKAANFHAAWNDLYRAKNFMQPPTFHVRHIHAGRTDRNNNQMERFNRELRALERSARGVKTMKTSLFRGMRIHHNFVRPHMGLGSTGDGHDCLTPARAAGIFVEGRNVWMTLIQNARLHRLRQMRSRGGGGATAAAPPPT